MYGPGNCTLQNSNPTNLTSHSEHTVGEQDPRPAAGAVERRAAAVPQACKPFEVLAAEHLTSRRLQHRADNT
eukprot:m.6544 g.6544  ORF g.6544 m.6544 type:complete len:72 (+) comp2673_c0_seq1:357-572(+)